MGIAATISGNHKENGSNADGSKVYAYDFGTVNDYQFNFATATTDVNGDWSITDAQFTTGETIVIVIVDPDEVYEAFVTTLMVD
jgi:hypothetical protein